MRVCPHKKTSIIGWCSFCTVFLFNAYEKIACHLVFNFNDSLRILAISTAQNLEILTPLFQSMDTWSETFNSPGPWVNGWLWQI